MPFTFTHRLRTTFLAAASLFFFAGAASAEECGDISCDEGFVCNTYGSADDEFYSCDRAPCESDDECGEFMICGTFENDCERLRVACAEGGCEPGVAEGCQPEYNQCAPTWELACDNAADCGEGFDCEPIEVCDCPLLIEPENEDEAPVCNDCRELDDKLCVQHVIDCTDDSDCATNWDCLDAICQPPSEVYGEASGSAILEVAATSEPSDVASQSGEVATLGDEEPVERGDESAADVDIAEDDADGKAIEDDNRGVDGKNVEDMGSDPQSSGGCSVVPVRGGNTGSALSLLALGLGAMLVGRRRRAS
jgi:hypothetical protein